MKRLLINFARVGDMVLMIPLLRHLARDSELELVGRPWARAVLGAQPWLSADAIHTLATPYRGHGAVDGMLYGASLRELAGVLRARGFDEIVTFRQESPKVLAWMRGWAGAATVRTLDSGIRTGASPHPIDMYRAALEAGGFAVDGYDPIPRLEIAPERLAAGRRRVAGLGARVVALQPGSSLTHRWWRRRPNLKGLTPAQWAGLLARLFAEGDADAVMILGSALERREAQAIIAALPPAARARAHDWSGRVSLEDLPGVLSSVRALLSVDTGPAHIAAAVACPSLVVFGPSDPKRWLPRGPGVIEALVGSSSCQFCLETPLFKQCRSNICLNRLPDEVIHAGWRRLRERLPETVAAR